MQHRTDVTITRLGGLGDGVGLYNGLPLYVPYTLPGETVRVEVLASDRHGSRARLLEVLTPSVARRVPPCPHFGQCGGCALQHMQPEAYRQYKQDGVAQMLARLGAAPEACLPAVEPGAGSRRRAELSVAVCKAEVALGYLAARSHAVTDITVCPVLTPALQAFLAPLKASIAGLPHPSLVMRVRVLEADGGMSALLLLRRAPKPAEREYLAHHARAMGMQQLAVMEEGSSEIRRLYGQEAAVLLAGVRVAVPLSAFQQASAAAQQAMTQQVLAYLAGCTHVADLYAGCGAYGFPLAVAGVRVHAFEGDAAMVAAMENACRQHGMEAQFSATQRDLHADPLSAAVLRIYDGCVLNPPRAGAARQTAQIAASALRRLVMVSCNPATFERDARCLLDAGFVLQEIVPVDQFHWSPHLELVAYFRRS